ncbi:ferredoxin [Streptomyces sp. TRM43335]|uniref:Ferredoxin n=1 Tax=Streptomyces taklimakanensis TaxID=2569853 RepID=A0A6G2B6C2_9ACTN|nr:ferredoxin [Streptomyces taklimakanensis]MTE17807.1 ferredoxin [Streptomyces taklimakanensis]
MDWRVEVDRRVCIGSGMCAALAPDLFVLEGAAAEVVRPETGPEERVLDAADSCPVLAIRVSGPEGVVGPRP